MRMAKISKLPGPQDPRTPSPWPDGRNLAEAGRASSRARLLYSFFLDVVGEAEEAPGGGAVADANNKIPAQWHRELPVKEVETYCEIVWLLALKTESLMFPLAQYMGRRRNGKGSGSIGDRMLFRDVWDRRSWGSDCRKNSTVQQ